MTPSFLPLALLLLLFIFSPNFSLSLRLSHPPILTVRGDGIAPLSVDESEITATIQSRIESPTPIVQANEINRTLLSLWIKTVQNKTAMISDKVKNYLQTPSIESIIKKLRTTSLSTTPLTQWKDGLMFYYGAESSHTFAFQTSVNTSGPIIDELIRIGVTRIDNVRLVSSDESQRLSRMAAIANATKNAWGKIKAAVEPFGWNIGELKQKDSSSNNIIDIDGLLVQENENPKNVNVEILSINVEGVTIRPPPQPREMLSSVGFASRMDESMIAPMVPPMPPSSTVFASDATMSASIVLRVRLTKINNSTNSNSRTMEGEITTASAHNNNNNNRRMTIDKIIRSSTGTTGVIIADNNNNNNDNNNYLNAELDEEETEQMMMNPNNDNY